MERETLNTQEPVCATLPTSPHALLLRELIEMVVDKLIQERSAISWETMVSTVFLSPRPTPLFSSSTTTVTEDSAWMSSNRWFSHAKTTSLETGLLTDPQDHAQDMRYSQETLRPPFAMSSRERLTFRELLRATRETSHSVMTTTPTPLSDQLIDIQLEELTPSTWEISLEHKDITPERWNLQQS